MSFYVKICVFIMLAMFKPGALSLAASGSSLPLSALNIPECKEMPVLDGNPNDIAWSDALLITNFVILDKENAFLPAGNITAKLMRNDEWLYVGFDIRHPEPDSIQPKITERDGRVQGEDCVKVAFDPGTGGKQWYHIRLSAGNIISDQRNESGRVDGRWNLPMRSATRITKEGWQAEMALPLHLLMERGKSEQACLNLLVHTFAPIRDPNAVVIGQTREVAALAKTPLEWWKTPEQFIPITGLKKGSFTMPFLPVLESAQVGGYRFDENDYRYNVSGHIRNYSDREGHIVLRVHDMPVAGASRAVVDSLTLKGGAATNFLLAVPVEALVRRNIHVDIELENGERLGRIMIVEPPVLDLFTAFLDRNYYTIEKNAGVTCRIALPAFMLQKTRLMARTEHGNVLGEEKNVTSPSQWSFSLGSLKEGRHPVRIELRDAEDALLAEQTVQLIKRAPRPGCEWKIDQVRRMALNNGEPYFAYGIILNSAPIEETLRDIAEAGFNSVDLWRGEDYNSIVVSNALDMAARYNLRMMVRAECFASRDVGFRPILPEGIERWSGFSGIKGVFVTKKDRFTHEERNRIFADLFGQAKPFIQAGLDSVQNHPALMSYESFEEPLGTVWFDQYVQGRELYQLIQQTDGYRPVRVCWNSGSPSYVEKYTDWSDVHARDPYWTPPVRDPELAYSRYGRSPNCVAREAADLAMRGKIDRKPTWLTPVLERWSSGHKRLLLPEEQRAQTYLAILYETSGLFYFDYPVTHQLTLDMMRQIGGELRELHPILAAPIPEHRIVYKEWDVDVVNGKMPDVHAALRYNPEGGYALFAVNSRPWPVRATFRLPFAKLGGVVRSLFGAETFPFSDGMFGDTLEPFGRRVFLVNAKTPATGGMWTRLLSKFGSANATQKLKLSDHNVLEVAVEQQALKDGYVPEPEIGREGRLNCKNIMPNPSFEEAALADFPDYYWPLSHHRPQSPQERTGREKALYSLDAQQPFHGDKSLRITAYERASLVALFLAPQHKQPTTYVWSAWMRAERSGTKAVFNGSAMSGVTKTLTTEWQRYHVKLDLPADVSRYTIFWLGVPPSGGSNAMTRIWVDAVQFEQGSEPTDFEP